MYALVTVCMRRSEDSFRLFPPSGSNIKLKLLAWQVPLPAEPPEFSVELLLSVVLGDGTRLCALFMLSKLSTTDILSSPPSLFLFLYFSLRQNLTVFKACLELVPSAPKCWGCGVGQPWNVFFLFNLYSYFFS